jgi:Raf kinase inhibitor-like YbhB/YbcL family protein
MEEAMIKTGFNNRKKILSVLLIFSAAALLYSSMIIGCGGAGGGAGTPSGNSFTPKSLEISGAVESAAQSSSSSLNANSLRAPAPINFASECEIKAFDINGSPIYGANGYFAGSNFFLSMPLTEDYGRYLLIVIRLKTGHEIYKRLLGRIPRYDDAPASISVSNLKLNGETTAKSLVLLEDASKLPAVEISSASLRTRFEIESEALINDADSTRIISPLKTAIDTVIKVMKVDRASINAAKTNYLSGVSSLLNSYVTIAKARETDADIKSVITETPQITLNGKVISSASGSADISGAVESIKETLKPAGVETPVFSPASGVFERAQSVVITCATAGAIIKYALHGNTPDENYGIIYGGPITVKESTAIKAVAIKSGLKNSTVAGAAYTILNTTVSPLVLDGISIGTQNGPIDFIYKNGPQALKNYDITRPYFEIEFKREDGNDFTLNQTALLRLKLSVTKIKSGAVSTVNYVYGSIAGAGETDFSEDFSAPLISGRLIKFNYKSNPARPVEDATYELKINEVQNVSYTNSNGLLSPNYSITRNISGSFNIYAAAQTLVSNPVFSPAGGSFNDEIYISLSCATPGAAIRYTLDSGNPASDNGTIFNNIPILISSSTVVKAIAYKTGMQSSPVIEASYLINKAAAPLFNPPPGVYAGERQITITSKTPGASIYYTLDGSTNPSRASALYLGPLIVSSSKLIKAVAVKDGMKDSNITSGEYIINKTEPPQFNPPAGTYAGAQNITLFTSTPGASIHYTLDGSAPGRFSPFYTGPIALSAYGTSEIKAIAYKTDMADSAVAGAVYLILERAAAPLFNPAAGVYDSARSVTITSATPGASIYYTLDGSAPNRFSALYSAPFEIKTSLKLRAIAIKDSMADSFITDGAYLINIPPVAKPVIYPSTGTYGGIQQVTITTATPGASIYYTLDESVPSASSIPYPGTIEVSQTSYIRAIALKAAMLDSEISESYITINMPRPKVEDPQFSPAAGTYTGARQLTLTCATAGAAIYYTLDGSRPTTSKNLYSAPFSINANSTVKAIAVKQPDLSDSNIVTAEYLIKVPAPAFSVAGGTYSEEKTVVITSGVSGASIYYTTNGATPVADQQYLYGGPVTVGRSMTLKAIAVKSGMLFSAVTEAQYVIKVKTPEFSPAPGNYTDTQSVAITCQTPNSSIYFTADGTPPTAAAGVLYTAPITVASNTTIKAIGIKSGLENSDIATGAYTVQPKAARPFLTPPGGVYNSARSVTIATLTPGAVIKYTTNGSVPTAASATYSAPVTVSATSEVKAIAVKAGMLDSDVASEYYIIDTNLQQAAAPSFNPPAGSYNEPQAVFITSATAGASIYYTLDGSYPSINSFKYLTPVTINSSGAVRAIAVKSGMANSSDSSAAYVIKAAAPSFTPPAGTYDAPQTVTIATATAGSVIRYTLDGSAPSLANGQTYSAPVTIAENTTLRAIAIKTGMANSDISQAAYSIRAAAPVMSLETGSYEGDQSVAITTATSGATIRYTTDGSDPSSTAGTLYSTAVSITATTTLKAIAYKNNMLDSAVTAKTYTLKTAAPVFSPVAGAYEGPKSIAISCATGGAVIYYTTDGSTPTAASAQYGAPFNLDSSQTIKAFAQKAGLAASNLTTAAYIISVPAPAFNPAPGTYQNAQNVSLSCAMSGASIHYTTDASTPTAASAQYSAPISVSTTTTIKAIAVKAGAQTSSVATGLYTIGVPAAAPVFTPPAGAYTGAQSVAITSSTAGASIYYTTNGSDPTAASTLYSAPITVSTTTTIKAVAIKAGMLNSAISSAAYTITIAQAAAPVFTPAAGTYTSAQTVAITSATAGASIYYTTNGSTPTAASTLYSAPLTVSTTTTIKAVAIKAGMTDSAVATAAYTINAAQSVAAPVFTPPGGTYSTIQNVTITSATVGADVHYTLDNTPPSASSTKYSTPIPVAASVTIKAIAVKAGMIDSTISTAEYTIVGNTFSLTTTAFANGGAIPAKYSGFGADVSPPFSWANAPAETKSFALVCSDDVNNTPENPQDDFIHWVIYNIPPTATGLAENITKTASVTSGVLPSGTAAQGKNSFGNIGYNGPAPPSGVHTYNFAIIALDQTPTLPPGLELMQFVMAINGKLISQTIYSGTYQAP